MSAMNNEHSEHSQPLVADPTKQGSPLEPGRREFLAGLGSAAVMATLGRGSASAQTAIGAKAQHDQVAIAHKRKRMGHS